MTHTTAIHRMLVAVAVLGSALTLSALPAAGASATARADAAIHVKIVGQNHDPLMNTNWKYTVTVTDAHGHPLSGTETTQYTFSGSVVGTEKPENVKFSGGVYHDTLQFPPAAVGHPLDVRATVKTKDGSGSASWAITVKQ